MNHICNRCSQTSFISETLYQISGDSTNKYCYSCVQEIAFLCVECNSYHHIQDQAVNNLSEREAKDCRYWIDNLDSICLDCFYTVADFCEHEKHYFSNRDFIYVTCSGNTICPDCYGEHYFTCERCNDNVELWASRKKHPKDGDFLCNTCFESETFTALDYILKYAI